MQFPGFVEFIFCTCFEFSGVTHATFKVNAFWYIVFVHLSAYFIYLMDLDET
jgi:hypothetical protein